LFVKLKFNFYFNIHINQTIKTILNIFHFFLKWFFILFLSSMSKIQDYEIK